jgi:DNA modification methylase
MKQGHVYLYGEIMPFHGTDAENYGVVSLSTVKNQIEKLDEDVEEIVLHINSVGGALYEAYAIFDFLSSVGKPFISKAEGTVASAATVIFMIAKVREITKNTIFLIHPPSNGAYGTADEIEKSADDLRNDELYNMLYASFKEVAQYLTKDGALYVFHASANQILFEKALNEAGFQVKQQLIWKKHHVLGHSHYHWNHEPLFYCSRKDVNPVFYGDRSNKTTIGEMDPDKMDIEQMRDYIKDLKAQSTCQNFDRDATKDYIPPTQKLVKMAEQFIVNSSKVGDLVLDMYAGSGSTLIACEKLKRRCRMIELDPTFVSHILERWETLTARRALNDKGEIAKRLLQ